MPDEICKIKLQLKDVRSGRPAGDVVVGGVDLGEATFPIETGRRPSTEIGGDDLSKDLIAFRPPVQYFLSRRRALYL
jgi:hypothetical protein